MLDLIIRGASIIDGTGRAAYTGDAAVSDGRIAAVGELGASEAARVIEARGRCLTPGFIDMPPPRGRRRAFAPAGAARSSPRA